MTINTEQKDLKKDLNRFSEKIQKNQVKEKKEAKKPGRRPVEQKVKKDKENFRGFPRNKAEYEDDEDVDLNNLFSDTDEEQIA